MLKAFSRLRIAVKLPLIMISLAALNAIAGFALSDYMARTHGLEEAEKKLAITRDAKTESLGLYLDSISQDLSTMATSDYVRDALAAYMDGWYLLGFNQKDRLQKLYITDNPNPLGEKHKLDAAGDGSEYSAAHTTYHPWFRHFLETKGYYDIFLFAPNGDLVYTVFKELDYATNLNTGEWKDTGLGRIFRMSRDNPEEGYQAFIDFEPYSPSADAPASFISQPILSPDGKLLGVIAFQMPIERINNVMKSVEGLGESGKAYLVGSDHLMRSQDRHVEENTILQTRIDDAQIDKALNGESDVEVGINESGDTSLISYEPIDFKGVRWAVITEVAYDEIMAPVYKQELYAGLTSLAILLVVAFMTVIYARQITRPINKMVDVMKVLANGDYTASVPSLERVDEIGDMAKAVQVFKENGLEMESMQAEQERMKQKAEEDKAAAMNAMANDFSGRTSEIIQALSRSAEAMQTTAQQMRQASAQTTQASTMVASSAEEASTNVQTVASATEELASSSSEIARQVNDVAQNANSAAHEAEATSASVQELNAMADSIGEVVGAIKDIADQTNLLALNATIEAARAGAAGKGFAVVADEVKKLATETAQKTEEIDQRVARIQGAIRSAVEAMNSIIASVRKIDSATTSVAGAVEEQNAATSEIGRNVTEASAGTSQVSEGISEVQTAATQTSQSADHVLQMASELAGHAETLTGEIGKFLDEVRGGKEQKRVSAKESNQNEDKKDPDSMAA
ncbi:MAG: methyl-accepting chemotaxis protein [Alphaproteobacteria bacterium]|nr:methyl-accepting chemotaxis protein [Alphaproteobacteria bacterium]MCD8570165.1 methyl-accepting chemotaxis protein [Alphaproteobacteria bacterium]